MSKKLTKKQVKRLMKAEVSKMRPKLKQSVLQSGGAIGGAGPKQLTGMIKTVKQPEMLHPVRQDQNALNQWQFNNLGFRDTNLQVFFDMYDRWLVHSITIRYTPTINKTISGTVHFCYEPDILDPAPGITGCPAVMARYPVYYATQACEALEFTIHNFKVDGAWVTPILFTAPMAEMRMSSFGKLFAMVEGVPLATIADQAVVGNLQIEPHFKFIQQQPHYQGNTWVDDPSPVDRIVNIGANAAKQVISDLVANAGSATGKWNFQNAASAAMTQAVDKIITGLVGDIIGTNVTVKGPNGDQIPYGTRVFARSSNKVDAAGQVSPIESNSEYVGQLALDPEFKFPISLGADANSGFRLESVSYW